jgi:hypothetical protein
MRTFGFENNSIYAVMANRLHKGEDTVGYFKALKILITKPTLFFKENAEQLGLRAPIRFFVITSIIVFLEVVLVSVLFPNETMHFSLLNVLIFIMVYLVIIALFMLLWAWMAKVAAKLLGGTGTFRATLAVYCYSSVGCLFAPIPIVQYLGVLLGIVLLIIGLREVQKINVFKSMVSLFLTLVLVVVITVVLFMLSSVLFKGKDTYIQYDPDMKIEQVAPVGK